MSCSDSSDGDVFDLSGRTLAPLSLYEALGAGDLSDDSDSMDDAVVARRPRAKAVNAGRAAKAAKAAMVAKKRSVFRERSNNSDNIMEIDSSGSGRKGKRQPSGSESDSSGSFVPLPESTDERRRRAKRNAALGVVCDFDDSDIVSEAIAEEEARVAADERRADEAAALLANEVPPAALSETAGAVIAVKFVKAGERKTLTVRMAPKQRLRRALKPACKKFGVASGGAVLVWESRFLPLGETLEVLDLPAEVCVEIREAGEVARVRVRGPGGETLEAVCLGMGYRLWGVRYAAATKFGVKEGEVVLHFEGQDVGEFDTPSSVDIDASDDAEDTTLLEARVIG